MIFYSKPASKVISRPSNQPSKQMTEAKKGVRERERGGRQRRTKTKKKRNRKQVLIDKISAEFDLSVFHVSFVTKSDHKLHAR